MKSMSAKEAKNGFGLLLDTARAEPVTIEKHGRPAVVVLSTEEYARLSGRSLHYEEGLTHSAVERPKQERTGKAEQR